jgi:hypothetical protein
MRNVMAVVAMTALSAGSVAAQIREAAPAPLAPQELREVKELRYQIRQMEAVLEGAVEHGATVMRDRLRVALPADMLLTEEARVRGFRLDGYGVFFDVEVPSLEGPLPWSFQTLEQSDLGIQSALETLRSFVQGRGANDANVQQALRRVELQVTPVGMARVASSTGTAISANQPPDVVVPLTQDQVNQSYRETISAALIDAMLEHSRGLNIAPGEVLSVAARGAGDRPRLNNASDADGQTWLIRVSGSDLTLFLGGQITREEAVKRVSVRVF